MTNGKKVGIAVGMVALALAGLTTGCRSGSFHRSNWTWGCLTEAESAGAPAYAELASVPTGEVVRVWSEGAPGNVTLAVLGGAFGDVAPGAHAAGPDGVIVTEDLAVELLRCEGEAEDDLCTSVDAASIEVELLGDGARRVTYRGHVEEDGPARPIEGSFVVGR